MKTNLQLLIFISIYLIGCTDQKMMFFDSKCLSDKLITNEGLNLSPLIDKAHQLNSVQVDSIERAILLYNDYNYAADFFLEEVNKFLHNNEDITFGEISKVMSKCFNKDVLLSKMKQGDFNREVYDKTIKFIESFEAGMNYGSIYMGSIFMEGIEYMEKKNVLNATETKELIMINFLFFITHDRNG